MAAVEQEQGQPGAGVAAPSLLQQADGLATAGLIDRAAAVLFPALAASDFRSAPLKRVGPDGVDQYELRLKLGKGCYFLVYVQLFEKCGTLIERYTALIEKVSALIAHLYNAWVAPPPPPAPVSQCGRVDSRLAAL
eukprot:SAG31_NODE_875_length_11316_cov_8.924044_12_plen_136_part_00